MFHKKVLFARFSHYSFRRSVFSMSRLELCSPFIQFSNRFRKTSADVVQGSSSGPYHLTAPSNGKGCGLLNGVELETSVTRSSASALPELT
jgi:hypothetical protein